MANMDDLFIQDLNTGSNRVDKLERDIELLLWELEVHPDRYRPHFYLGMSYQNLGQYQSSIEHYTKRLEHGGFDEENWFAKMQIGVNHIWLNNKEKAVWYLLDAYNMYPDRLEPLCYLVELYRKESSKQRIAYTLAQLGLKDLTENPPVYKLFIDGNSYYPWGRLAYELSIICPYLGKTEEGLAFCDAVIHHPNGWCRDYTINSVIGFYADPPREFPFAEYPVDEGFEAPNSAYEYLGSKDGQHLLKLKETQIYRFYNGKYLKPFKVILTDSWNRFLQFKNDGKLTEELVDELAAECTFEQGLFMKLHYYRIKALHDKVKPLVQYWNIELDDKELEYDIKNEFSILLYYQKEFKNGLIISDDLITQIIAPCSVKNLVLKNRVFYYENIPHLKVTKGPFISKNPVYVSCNPSIVKIDTGYKVIVRTVSYRITKGQYSTPHPEGLYNTVNYLQDYDNEFNLISSREIVNKSTLFQHRLNRKITGLEDMRLFRYRDRWWATYTNPDHHLDCSICIGICRIDDDGSVIFNKVLPVLNKNKCEKNWMPFVENDEIYVIYNTHPTRIFKIDLYEGDLIESKSHVYERQFVDLRGSAGPLLIEGLGYLILVHESTQGPESRKYLHRWVLMEPESKKVTHVSIPFMLLGNDIEMCLSMSYGNDNNVILAVGAKDCEYYFISCSLDVVKGYLRV